MLWICFRGQLHHFYDTSINFINHSIKISQNQFILKKPSSTILELNLDILEHLLVTQRDYNHAYEFSNLIKKHYDDNNTNLQQRWRFLINISAIDITRGNYLSGMNHTEEAITIYELHPDQYSYDAYLRMLLYRASNAIGLGHIDVAKNIEVKVSKLVKENGYSLNDDWATFMNTMLHHKIIMNIQFSLGQYQKALHTSFLIRQTIENHEKSNPGKTNRKMFLYFDYHHVLLTSLAGKDIDIAQYRNLWKQCEVDIENGSTDTIHAMILSAWSIAELKCHNITKAEQKLKSAFQLLQDWVPEFEKSTDYAFLKLINAKILMVKNFPEAALTHLKQAENIYSNSMSSLDSSEISMLYSLLSEATYKCQNEIGTQHYINKHNDIFGTKHFQSRKLQKYVFETALDA